MKLARRKNKSSPKRAPQERGYRRPFVAATFAMTVDGKITTKNFSPIDSLSSGRTIGWDDLARAVFQIWVVMGGFMAVIGITAFNRRELATAQGTN